MRRLILHLVILFALLSTSGIPAKPQESKVEAPGVQGTSINGAVLTEDSCELLVSVGGQKPALREAPDLHVLNLTASHPLKIVLEAGAEVRGVMCWRSEGRLAPNDFLVPNTVGVSFFIKTDTGDPTTDRTIALEKINGSFRVRQLSGPDWTPAEEEEMIAAMTRFNQATSKAPAASPGG